MKLIDREPIGRTRFLKLEKILALRYPPKRKKVSVNIDEIAKAIGAEYGVTYANWRQAGGMAVAFEKRIMTMLENRESRISVE